MRLVDCRNCGLPAWRDSDAELLASMAGEPVPDPVCWNDCCERNVRSSEPWITADSRVPPWARVKCRSEWGGGYPMHAYADGERGFRATWMHAEQPLICL